MSGARRLGARLGLRWVERALFLIAFLCLGSYGYVALHSRVVQYEAGRHFDAALAARRAAALPGDAGDSRVAGAARGGPAAVRAAVPVPAALQPGDVVGRLEVPRVGVSVMVLEGDDDDILRQAAGHIPGTGLPGPPGLAASSGPSKTNVGIAGHRDTFFRPLRDVRPGDEIRLTTGGGAYRYTVDSTRIVPPEDVAVLDPVDHPVLTLVTCYPFYFVGHAPKRFIVRASLVASSPG